MIAAAIYDTLRRLSPHTIADIDAAAMLAIIDCPPPSATPPALIRAT